MKYLITLFLLIASPAAALQDSTAEGSRGEGTSWGGK